MVGLKVKETVLPKEFVTDFNEWMGHIKSQVNKSKNIKNK
jgi:hypothetical protein